MPLMGAKMKLHDVSVFQSYFSTKGVGFVYSREI